METSKEGKRRKDRISDDEDRRREHKSKRARTRSRSPVERRERDSRRKRRYTRSRSPNVPVKQEKQANLEKESDHKKEVPARRAKETDMLNTRTGGAYIPPARLRMMQAQITDKSSVAYQRLAWEALKKSIHGHINKINVGNIGIIIKELLKENIVRGRGLLCRSVIQAQAASPTFTNVYAALVAAVNSRFPNIGELLLKRLVIQFKRGFKRNDKPTCISSASFIAHLVNQRVAHEILALELLTLLVETPTDDSVEVAIAFLKECGQKLTEVSSKGVNAIFEMLRNILHEGQLDKRVQYMIEVMFQVWKDGFKDHPALIEELELVPEEDQFTHLMMLDEATDPQDILNVFKFDDKYEENEQKYKTLSKEILGSDVESGEDDSSGESGSEEEDDDEEQEQKEVTIIDNTETNLVALRRTIYLTINSSLDFEECAHKLMKMQLKPGQEVELCHMFLDCCAEQRTYEKFYGLLAQRFCNINRIYIGPFEEIFKDSYATAHRLDTNRLRNVSKFFAHLLFTDSISWEVLECVKLNEEDTTSSSRIYIKILFQELAEYMGLKKLNDRLKDPTLQEAFSGLFPRDNPKNTRFSINFFTSIGLGGLTDELREHLKQMPKNVPPPVTEIKLDSESSSDSSSDSSSSSSDSSSSSSDSSSSDEEEERSKKKKTKSKKNKSKDKESETLAEQVANDKTERWGHDGFYDTYGQGAKRLESRPERQDREEFGKPWDRRNNQRNGDDRRGRRNDEQDDDFRRNRGRDDQRGRRDDRSHRVEGRNREDDTQNERDNTGRRDDDWGRRNADREDRQGDRSRNDDRNRREDDRNRDNDRMRKEPVDDERLYRNEDRSRRNDDRSRRDDDRGRRDDDRGRRDDDRGRRDDDRGRRDDDRIRRDDDRSRRDDDRSRREDETEETDNRARKDDDRSRRVDDKVRRGDDRTYRDENRGREDLRGRKGDENEYRDDRERKGEDKPRRDEERSRRDDERSRRDDERQRRGDERSRDDDRGRRQEDREQRDDNRVRRADDNETREDRARKGDDRPRRDDDRNPRADDKEYREERLQKDDKERKRNDKLRREEEVDNTRNKKKTTEERSERDLSRRKGKDVDENDSRSKRKDHNERNERYQNGDDTQHDDDDRNDDNKYKDVVEEPKSKKSAKEHKKKNKKVKKSKKGKKKRKDSDSDDSGKSESDSSESASDSDPEDDPVGPGRYWDKFDLKPSESSRQDVAKVRSRRERS